jgi:hypothetical protein
MSTGGTTACSGVACFDQGALGPHENAFLPNEPIMFLKTKDRTKNEAIFEQEDRISTACAPHRSLFSEQLFTAEHAEIKAINHRTSVLTKQSQI